MNKHTMIDKQVQNVIKNIDTPCMSEILRICNTKLLFAKLDDATGGFTVSTNRCYTVVVNGEYSESMQRFVTFHEIGHLKLHNGVSTPFYRNISLDSFIPTIEREANEFALKLLLSLSEETINIQLLSSEIGLPQSMVSYL